MAVSKVVASELERAMSETPLLRAVSRASVRRFAHGGRLLEFRRGSYLFHQGDDAPDVYFLFQGLIEISSLSSTGHRQLLTTLDTPQFFGELGVLGDVARTTSALAQEESLVWTTPGGAFLGFLASHPEVSREVLRALARQVIAHESFVEDLLYLDLKGRVAKRLLQLVSPSLDELPPDGAELPAAVTHANLASLCGGSRENVTRILSEFQRRGLIERAGRRYALTNVNGLSRLAGL
jgi:CRP-like cAMP-binding protein